METSYKKALLAITALFAMTTATTAKTGNDNNASPKYAGYIFAYFEGTGKPEGQEHLRFAISEDAKN